MALLLFIAANPAGTSVLAQDEELRVIRKAIESSGHGHSLAVLGWGAARHEDVVELITREQPDIVHFSGHCDRDGRFLLVGKDDTETRVDPALLAEVFEKLADRCQLVVLSGCWTKRPGEQVKASVGCVVATTGDFDDRAAIAFAGPFYRGIALGDSVQRAFDAAQLAVKGTMAEQAARLTLLEEPLDVAVVTRPVPKPASPIVQKPLIDDRIVGSSIGQPEAVAPVLAPQSSSSKVIERRQSNIAHFRDDHVREVPLASPHADPTPNAFEDLSERATDATDTFEFASIVLERGNSSWLLVSGSPDSLPTSRSCQHYLQLQANAKVSDLSLDVTVLNLASRPVTLSHIGVEVVEFYASFDHLEEDHPAWLPTKGIPAAGKIDRQNTYTVGARQVFELLRPHLVKVLRQRRRLIGPAAKGVGDITTKEDGSADDRATCVAVGETAWNQLDDPVYLASEAPYRFTLSVGFQRYFPGHMILCLAARTQLGTHYSDPIGTLIAR